MLQWEGPKTQVLISCHGTLLPGNGRPLSLCHIKILEGGLEYYLFFWRMLLRYALQGLLPGHCNNFAEAYDKYWIIMYSTMNSECAHIFDIPLFSLKYQVHGHSCNITPLFYRCFPNNGGMCFGYY